MTRPHFDMGPSLEYPDGRKYWDPKPCVCGLTTYVDAATGLCRECWRAWRFSTNAAGMDLLRRLATYRPDFSVGGPSRMVGGIVEDDIAGMRREAIAIVGTLAR